MRLAFLRIRSLSQERGQALILFVGVFTVIALAGAVVVDFGLWFSERRGAQTDADLASLAGAREYALWLAAGSAYTADPDGAADAATRGWLGLNDETGNATLVNDAVGTDNPCVSVDVDHESRALFSGIFGMAAPDIGAHARACAGALAGVAGATPIEIDNNGPCFDASEQPIFTQLCVLEFGADDDNPRGVIDLQAPGDFCSYAPGDGDIVNMITDGATGRCDVNTTESCDPANNGPWYDCVAVQGGNPKKVIQGFSQRIATEGSCDDDGSGVEEFDETVVTIVDTGDPTTSIYEARICPDGQPSPRIMTIVVLEDNPPPSSGNTGFPIVGFAGFYAVGCYAGDDPFDEAEIDFECTELGPGSPPGHVAVIGRFVNLTLSGGVVGDPNSNSTLFGVTLVE